MTKNYDYKVRLAEMQDVASILNIYTQNIGTEGCTWDDEYPSMQSIIEDIKLKSLYCLVDSNEEIIAVATAGPLNELDDPAMWNVKMQNPCELARIGVLPSMKNRGMATRLLAYVIEDCKKRGYDSMRFLVSKTNYYAQKLYSKFGFQNAGEVFMYGRDYYCYYKMLI